MKVFVWADGTWCFPDELSSMGWMSDDCESVEVPDDCEDVDKFLEERKK